MGFYLVWNTKAEHSIEEYVDLTYDEDGESLPPQFFMDFNIDIGETDAIL